MKIFPLDKFRILSIRDTFDRFQSQSINTEHSRMTDTEVREERGPRSRRNELLVARK